MCSWPRLQPRKIGIRDWGRTPLLSSTASAELDDVGRLLELPCSCLVVTPSAARVTAYRERLHAKQHGQHAKNPRGIALGVALRIAQKSGLAACGYLLLAHRYERTAPSAPRYERCESFAEPLRRLPSIPPNQSLSQQRLDRQ